MDSKVYLAFRFHVNFYHSYRRDTPDELGYGKDIRIIRGILDDLDRLNAEGVHVRGTWDIENYYSLEKYIPRFAPEITERIKARVDAGLDAVELMSYNNGLVSAETEEEFTASIKWSVSNPEGSGLADVFGRYENVVRPQECMYTPSHLKLYKKCGVDAISIYYSMHPFNGFSTFVPHLSFGQRYNPLTVKSSTQEESMTLLPAYNHGDIADWRLSLGKWVKDIHKEQVKVDSGDLLLLIDMDADDDFWSGMDVPLVSKLFASFGGLYRLVKSVASLPYAAFTTPGEYIERHGTAGEIYLEQDTADGSFDGLSSWSEKWVNTQFWTRINRARQICGFVESLYKGKGLPDAIKSDLDACLKQRLLSHSTTHFGLSSPVMNTHRLKTALKIIESAEQYAQSALNRAEKSGIIKKDSAYLNTQGRPVLKRLERNGEAFYLTGRNNIIPYGIKPIKSLKTVEMKENEISNGRARAAFSEGKISLLFDGKRINAEGFPRASVKYGGKKLYPKSISAQTHVLGDDIACLALQGETGLGGDKFFSWRHRYIIAGDQPYIYVEVTACCPETEHRKFDGKLAEKLGTSWDGRWEEVMPFEFRPEICGSEGQELCVIKHNFSGDVSGYKLNYHTFSNNRSLSSFNNHITNGFVGVSNGARSLFMAQSCDLDNSFAFCPMRLYTGRQGRQTIYMNPFGTYHGKQHKYDTAKTGLGRVLALLMADHLRSYAPSFNGKSTHFMLMLASAEGTDPTDRLKEDMMAFSAISIKT